MNCTYPKTLIPRGALKGEKEHLYCRKKNYVIKYIEKKKQRIKTKFNSKLNRATRDKNSAMVW